MEKEETIETNTVVVRAEEPVFTELDGETVLLNVATSAYHGLDEIGTRIWALIEKPLLISEMCGILQEEFDVEPEQCEKDVLVLLQQLKEADLLRIVEDAPGEPPPDNA